MKKDLEFSQQKLKNFTDKVAETSEQVDAKKQEKEQVVDRLTKMEHELKVLVVSENLTDQSLSQLQLDNSQLRAENRNLVKVVVKLSK